MRGLLLASLLALAGPAAAQPLAQAMPQQSPLLTVTQERLLTGTKAGKVVQDRFAAAPRTLVAETREIEAGLEAEERVLTERRVTMPAAEFRVLADAFDTKVEEIRSAQDAKSRSLTRQRDEDRQKLFEATVPVLAKMMQDMGAVAILERGAILLSFDAIDITDEAIAILDTVLGDGIAVPDPIPADDAGTPRGQP